MKKSRSELYCFLNNEDDDWTYIGILEGPLENSKIKINYVGFNTEDDDNPQMNIDYDWIEKPKYMPTKNTISSIIGYIVSDILENFNYSLEK